LIKNAENKPNSTPAAPVKTEIQSDHNAKNVIKANNSMQNYSNFSNVNNNEDLFLNLEDDEDNLYKQNESSNYFKLSNVPDIDTKSLMKLNQMNESYPKFMNNQAPKDNM